MQVPREIIVSFSGGKDANATLDICARQFDRIEAFFLYWVKGLEFQELVLERAERTYGVKILRLPHFALPTVLGEQIYGFYGANYPQFRTVRMREVQDYVRGKFGLQWIASGEKKSDSFTRRFMMMASSQWDQKRFHYYPLMDWTNTQVYSYLRMRHIPLPPEYRWLKTSWGIFAAKNCFTLSGISRETIAASWRFFRMPRQLKDATKSTGLVPATKTELQKFTMRRMLRSELTAAPYNPRQIDENARKKLRASLKKVGLVQPTVYNERTGHIVAGHQRLQLMDGIEKKDYELDVAVIDVDEKTEKEINIFLNNELAMGTFDLDKLEPLMTVDGLDALACGFEKFELALLLPSLAPPMSEGLESATKDVTNVLGDLDVQKKKAKELKKKITDDIERRDLLTKPESLDPDLYVVLVFPHREMSDEFLKFLKLPDTEKYISGQMVFDMLRRQPVAEPESEAPAPSAELETLQRE